MHRPLLELLRRVARPARAAALLAGAAAVLAVGCGEDILRRLPQEQEGEERPVPCAPGEERIGGLCMPPCAEGRQRVGTGCEVACAPPLVPYRGRCEPLGAVTGRVCDDDTGQWVRGASVGLVLDDGTSRLTQTSPKGSFSLPDVPPGEYELLITAGPTFQDRMMVHVAPGATTSVGPRDCGVGVGHVRGRVCDPALGVWAAGVTVTVAGGPDAVGTTVTTDAQGTFILAGLPPGTYELTARVPSGDTVVLTAQVTPNDIAEVGPPLCDGTPGTVTGRICGAPGVWLVGARVGANSGGTWTETTTDASGRFTLTGLDPGPTTLHVVTGSLSMTFDVFVRADVPTVLGQPMCLALSANVAVVTGLYDHVEDILTGLGYRVRASYGDTGETVLDPTGTLDLIDGGGATSLDAPPWVTDFLLDPQWLNSYDILFIGCGVSTKRLAGTFTDPRAEEALTNLAAFVANGGSLYVSDWAYEVLRLAFPGRIAFHNDGEGPVASKVGVANFDLPAVVLEPSLSNVLATSEITLNLEMGGWVVMQPEWSQPPGLQPFVGSGDILIRTGTGDGALQGYPPAPLMVMFTHGQGRVLYTSFHNDSQNTRDLEEVLRFGVFEL